jgi:para-aminobenzoate synthetase/4-amino-4-deoxychorismate lyase
VFARTRRKTASPHPGDRVSIAAADARTVITPVPFLLLDDRAAPATTPASRLYASPVEHVVCRDAGAIDATCARIDAALAAGQHVALALRFELGHALLRIDGPPADGPLIEALVCAAPPRRLDRAGVDAWLAAHDDGAPAGLADARPTRDLAAYTRGFDTLQRAIADGECYQGNLTFALHADVFGTPAALWRRLAAAQPTAFGALGRLADGWVLSASPELFVERIGDVLRAKPMKGTAARDADPRTLRDDAKTRAENVMIVDLLRNDLGRIADTGSVTVPSLFDLEALPTAWQMTSTVQARRTGPLPLRTLLDALFPCGSVTGAPKRRAMQVLAAIEAAPRGLYCGALGWLDPGGDLRLSVAIRTLELDATARRAKLGIGSGVVADSTAAAEHAESQLKARFATALDPGFALIETLRVEHGAPQRLDAHLDRVAASARTFGFAWDRDAFERRLRDTARALASPSPHRLRATLAHDGTMQTATAPLDAVAEPVGLAWADGPPLDPHDRFLAHKTTWRNRYDTAVALAVERGLFDLLFVNTRGEVCEGARSALFARVDGRWCTPPLAAGALPSVMRAAVLADPAWRAIERPLTRTDVEAADALLAVNSVRGVLRARLVR